LKADGIDSFFEEGVLALDPVGVSTRLTCEDGSVRGSFEGEEGGAASKLEVLSTVVVFKFKEGSNIV
jgi:hypothetical protein